MYTGTFGNQSYITFKVTWISLQFRFDTGLAFRCKFGDNDWTNWAGVG